MSQTITPAQAQPNGIVPNVPVKDSQAPAIAAAQVVIHAAQPAQAAPMPGRSSSDPTGYAKGLASRLTAREYLEPIDPKVDPSAQEKAGAQGKVKFARTKVQTQKTAAGEKVACKTYFDPVTLNPNDIRGEFLAFKLEDENIVSAKAIIIQNEAGEVLVYDNFQELKADLEEIEAQIKAGKMTAEDRYQMVGIVMEPLKGSELFDFINARARLDAVTTVDFSLQLFHGLKTCDQEGVVHRDLKLENIFVVDGKTIKIIDFGMARKADPRMMTSCGSPHYVAPEVLKDTGYDKRAEAYTAGVLMYTMVTGTLPFDDDNIGALLAKIEHYGQSEKGHSSFETAPSTKQWINTMRNPGGRYAAIADVIVGLTQAHPADRITIPEAIAILEKAKKLP